MRYLYYLLLPFATLILSGCAKTTSIRHTADYANSIMQLNAVLVLPTKAEVHTLDAYNRKERMYDYEYYIEDLINVYIVPALQAKGFRAKLLNKKDIRDQKLYDVTMDLRRSYDKLRDTLYSPLMWEEKKAFAITQKVNEAAITLGQQTNSDILLMVDYSSAVKTNGARIRDFALSVFWTAYAANNADNSMMIIGIIDAKTGNILWSNMSSDSKNLYSSALEGLSAQKTIDQKRVISLITSTLKPLKTHDSGKD